MKKKDLVCFFVIFLVCGGMLIIKQGNNQELKEYILKLREEDRRDDDVVVSRQDSGGAIIESSQHQPDIIPSQQQKRLEDDNDENKNNNNNNPPPKTNNNKPRKEFTINNAMQREAIVIEEYQLLFVPVAKVGSSLIKRLMMRMNHNPLWCEPEVTFTGNKGGIHHPSISLLVNLGTLPVEKQEEIMTSSNWTRAIFVREPKERILSAFQDKAFHKNGKYFKTNCCPKTPNETHCHKHFQEFAYFLEIIAHKYCNHDLHWLPLHQYIDDHWWPWIDFVGYSDKLADDFETLLKSLHSNKDGVNAWERFGKTGWDLSDDGCHETSNVSFGRQIHHTKANGSSTSSVEKLKQYYTPELEKLVEHIYQKDWQSPYYHFPPIQLF